MALPAVQRQPSLRERIRAEIDFDPKADDHRVAERILRSVAKADLMPLLVDAVGTVRREKVRRHEHVLDGLKARMPKLRAVSYTPDERRNLLSRLKLEPKDFYDLCRQKIDMGNGTSARWGAVSVKQLIQRREMLLRQQAGLRSTIERLDTVIQLLEKTGADCLDDLKPLIPA